MLLSRVRTGVPSQLRSICSTIRVELAPRKTAPLFLPSSSIPPGGILDDRANRTRFPPLFSRIMDISLRRCPFSFVQGSYCRLKILVVSPDAFSSFSLPLLSSLFYSPVLIPFLRLIVSRYALNRPQSSAARFNIYRERERVAFPPRSLSSLPRPPVGILWLLLFAPRSRARS